MLSWLRFFRVVNLPTVPGDILVGVGAALFGATYAMPATRLIIGAVFAVMALYLFGLADNDIVGAATDPAERPIPAGEISPRSANIARMMCLFFAVLIGAAFDLPSAWWIIALSLVGAILAYNRTKAAFLMGLCRALNLICGATLVLPSFLGRVALPIWVAVLALLWLGYTALITHLSIGEESRPKLKQLIGFLVGAFLYLQLLALIVMTLLDRRLRYCLLTGAFLLFALRILKRLFPKVSAS